LCLNRNKAQNPRGDQGRKDGDAGQKSHGVYCIEFRQLCPAKSRGNDFPFVIVRKL
jgi:hypothetical protein